MWIVFAILAGIFYTGQGLITRHLLRQQKDAWAFSFYFSFIGALISFPFMLANMKIAKDWSGWIAMIVVGLLIVLQNLFNFKSSNFLVASIQGAITKFRLVWVLILSFIVLHEAFSYTKILGTLLTVMAGVIILKKINNKFSLKGILFCVMATMFYATVIILYKFLFNEFNSQSLTFFIFIIPAVINLLIMPRSIERMTRLIKSDFFVVVFACTFGGFANLTMNYALSIGEASRVLVFIESFLIATLVGEYIFLKEKDYMRIKIIAVFLATMGAVLIRL